MRLDLVYTVKLHLILHRRHIISFISPVNGVWVWSVASEEVPFGSRAVLQKAAHEITTRAVKQQANKLITLPPAWMTLPVAQTRAKTF